MRAGGRTFDVAFSIAPKRNSKITVTMTVAFRTACDIMPVPVKKRRRRLF
jgi:hypothetical protein